MAADHRPVLVEHFLGENCLLGYSAGCACGWESETWRNSEGEVREADYRAHTQALERPEPAAWPV